MKFRIALLVLCAAVMAQADTIGVTFTNLLAASGDPANPPLIGNGSGSVTPLGAMTWSDMAFPNLATGAVTGTFTMTFANGTLFGNLGEQLDFTAPPNATPSTQTITVTGGTGAFLWYNGVITASGVINLVSGAPVVFSRSGTLTTTPEPGSLALLPLGLMGFYFIRRKVTSRA